MKATKAVRAGMRQTGMREAIEILTSADLLAISGGLAPPPSPPDPTAPQPKPGAPAPWGDKKEMQ